jgi:DNA-binding NtrC family response regulator
LFHSETHATLVDNLKDKNFNLNRVKIIILDDDKDVLLTAKLILRSPFEEVITLTDPDRVEQHLAEGFCQVVLLDMNYTPGATSGIEGLRLLRKIREWSPNTEVVIHTAWGEIPIAVKAMKEGAFDFIEKPWEKEKLLATCQAAAKHSLSTRELSRLKDQQEVLKRDLVRNRGNILTISPIMLEVMQSVRKVAGTDASVLILGENGTGKELIAREIHRLSSRSAQPFIPVDVAALSQTLIESELFGHVKGAFTDAREDRTGRFELASGGTLFLDEIGNLPLVTQPKLLAALQNRQIVKVGANRPVDIDIRLISATNMPLYDMIRENEFRQDLLYRINTVEIKIPPLRERMEDLPLLLGYFVERNKKKYMKNHLVMKEDNMNILKNYHWPGNIRELEHAAERAVIMCDREELLPEDFLPGKSTSQHSFKANALLINVHEAEKQLIEEAIRKCKGNLTRASKELGMGRTTLYRRLKNSDR